MAAVACAAISAGVEHRPFFYLTGYSSSAWWAVVCLGLLPWGLAMVLWMWVLKRLEVGQVSASIYLLPFFGLLLSVLTVHDQMRVHQALGGVLVLIGTLVLTVYERRQQSAFDVEGPRG